LAAIGTLEVLTEEQAARFRACEASIQKLASAFVEAGTALATVKKERFWTQEYDSFESYCRLRWGLEMSKVNNWMAAASLFNSLSAHADVPPPENEAQMRPLRGLSPAEAQIAWRAAVALSGGRRSPSPL
jgi:hypothetical protein